MSDPYLDMMRDYCDEVRVRCTKRTADDYARRLTMLYDALVARNMNTDPSRISKEEIVGLMSYMKDSDYASSTQFIMWSLFQGFLRWCGNHALDDMRIRKQWRMPPYVTKPVYIKDDDWVRDAMEKLARLGDWHSHMISTAIAIYYATGLRPKELRRVALSDLDTENWYLSIKHPKGEGTWASDGERVKIFPSIQEDVLDYLDMRQARFVWLRLTDVEPLFPTSKGDYYTEAGWTTLRMRRFRKLGIDGNYKILRPSFAQRAKDRGVPIEAVSKALRHSNTLTTEKFYARIRSEMAWNDIERAWENPSLVQNCTL